MFLKQIFILIPKLKKNFCLFGWTVSMLRDDFWPPLLNKGWVFNTRGRCFWNILKTVIQLNAPLHFASFKKKLSELDFWFSSYDHFTGIICEAPSSGQTVIYLFFNNPFKNLCLFSERDFNFEVEIFCSATRGSNWQFTSKLRTDYSYIRHFS